MTATERDTCALEEEPSSPSVTDVPILVHEDIYSFTFQSGDARLEELLQFGEALKHHQHPNIAPVLELHADGSRGELVVEGRQGTPLSHYLSHSAPSLAEIRSLAVQLAAALSYLYKIGVSGDLTPAHVLVRAGRLVVTGANLLPFSWIDWSDLASSPLTRAFKAPERAEPSDERSLVYAVGVALFHMVTGVAAGSPPAVSGPSMVAFEHFVRGRMPPSSLRASVPEDWDALILKAIASEPSDRFSTLGSLRDAITRLSVAPRCLETEPGGQREVIAESVPPMPVPAKSSEPVSAPGGRVANSNARLLWGMAAFGLLLALLMYAVAWLVMQERARVTPTSALPVVRGLHVYRTPVTAGANVRLNWIPVRGASGYRLRLTSVRGHHTAVVRVRQPHYTLKRVPGPQAFVWMVSARAAGRSGPFSQPASFVVPAHHLSAPLPLRPLPQSVLHHATVSFCWRPVGGATTYLLRIGTTTVDAHSSCVRRNLPPGSHLWSVAARTQSVGLYTSTPSKTRAFTIVIRHAAARTLQLSAPTAAAPASTLPLAQPPATVVPAPATAAPPALQPPAAAPEPVAAATLPPAIQPKPVASCVAFINC